MKKLIISIILVCIGIGFYFSNSIFSIKEENESPEGITLVKGEKPPKIRKPDRKFPEKGDADFEPEKKPSEWFFLQRAYPHNEIKFESVKHAYHQARNDRAAMEIREDNLWEFVGPTNIGGRVVDLAIHPDYPDVIYAAAATGGILKSVDGGETWEAIFDDVGICTIGAVAIDPQDPETIYVGTGEANANSYSFFGMGVYKSTDGGESWQHLGLENTRYIGKIVVDPTNSEKVFLAATGKLFGTNSERGVYRTLDGGETWEKVLFVSDSTAATDIAIHPQNPNIVYASMWERIRGLTYRKSGGWTTGIWRSLDGGETWDEMLNGLPKGENVGRPGIALCNADPDILYAMYADHPGNFLGVYKTTNGGDSWSGVNDSSLNGMFSGFGWYFGRIVVNPSNSDQVFALGVSLHRSNNGGNTWTTIADYSNDDEIHVDHHTMWIDPNTGYIVEGNDGGIYFSSDYGDNWVKSMNLPISQFYAIAIDNSQPHRLYGGTQDNGTLRTWDGSIDNWDHILGGDGFYCLVHPQNSNTIWAESQWGNLYKSVDAGNNWNWATAGIGYNDRTNWSTPVVMDPSDPDVMYYGSHRVYRSTNGAASWTPISDDLTNGDQGGSFGTITTIAVAPTDSDVILVGTDDGNVWITYDGGSSWAVADYGLPERWITRVEVDPTDEMICYVTVSGFRWEEEEPHVFRSIYGGMSWEDISGDLPDAPVNVIRVDPENTNILYVGTDFGVYYTIDLGGTWMPLGDNHPMVPVLDLKIHNQTRKLVSGTHGRSMLSYDLNQLPASVEKEQLAKSPSSGILKQNYPNPFNPTTTIAYELPSNQRVSLKIYNSSGQLVAEYDEGVKAAGNHKIVWDSKDNNGNVMNSGVYLYRLEGDGWAITKKMQLVK